MVVSFNLKQQQQQQNSKTAAMERGRGWHGWYVQKYSWPSLGACKISKQMQVLQCISYLNATESTPAAPRD